MPETMVDAVKRVSIEELRSSLMTLDKRDLIIVSDLMMQKGCEAAQSGKTLLASCYDDVSLEAWLLATN